MAFFEIRQYEIRPEKMEEWLDLMHRIVIPFMVGQGMHIIGSFRGEEDESVYIWIRRFESEKERTRLYALVYESDYWKNQVSPQVGKLIVREAIVVQRVAATEISAIQ